ncbi:Early nodulin-like protein [Actinidia chinensis var. chinensis]|uniref:Early nodulin-like protein n=1 Tax=Actinidia chinensis var. chinensis TaxID=1590841 RepID=A0A2R6PUF6_ACTCC|nr:Early nodulin-like protein [Actinidia chinensis var. chinensis]
MHITHMASLRSVWLLLALFAGLMGSLKAYQFNVGGKDGWVQNPSESYSNWSSRMRFQINDALFFKYMQGTDSVLVVSKEDYDTCNTQKPIMKLDGGDSVFKFDRSGPFFFISGNKSSCDKGQKLNTVVIALRNQPKSTPPTTPPSETGAPAPGGQIPATPPKSPSPTASTPSQPPPATTPATSPPPAGQTPAATSPSSFSPSASTPSHTPPSKNPAISPAPMGQTPVTSPNSPSPSTSNSSQSPTPYSPAMSPVTGGPTPGTSPSSPSQSPSVSTPSLSPASNTPEMSPTMAPVGQTPATSPNSPSPSVSTPSPSPAATTPATSPAMTPATQSPATLSPPGENGPNADGAPANTDASGLPDSSSPAFTPSIVFVSLVTIVLSVFMGDSFDR